MTVHALKLMSFGRPEARQDTATFGEVSFQKVASFKGVEGRRVFCTSGYLWLTLENDRADHVVRAGESFQITAPGRLIIGGRGCYSLEPAPLARAV